MISIAKALLLMYNAYHRNVIHTQYSTFHSMRSLEPNSKVCPEESYALSR